MSKLAIIRQQYRPDGGAERFIERALEQMGQQDTLDVSILTRQWPKDKKASFNIVAVNPPKISRIGREKLFANQCQKHFECFDLIQSHERIPGCHIFRAGDGVHRVWLEHKKRVSSGFQSWLIDHSRYHNYVKRAEESMFSHPNLKCVICNSQMVKDEITEHFNLESDKISVIYNGVDQRKFSPSNRSLREEILKKHSIPTDSNILIYVGSGFERKGLKQAICALAQTSRNWHLLVVGKDKSEKNYRSLASKLGIGSYVHFVGKQSETHLYYGCADVLIIPTLYDPFPNVILEAMATGLPIITSTTCGGKEFVENANCGYVCDALDVKAIARAMDKLGDISIRKAMSKNALTYIKPFTLEKVVEQLLALYNRLINNS